MKKLSEGFEKYFFRMTDFLTKERSEKFVRNLQLILIFITLVFVTYILSFPYMGREKINLEPEGSFTVGKFAPETVVSYKEILYEDVEKTASEKQKAYQSGAFVFNRDFTILTDGINQYIREDFENLKAVSSQGFGKKSYPDLIGKNQRWRNRTKEELDELAKYQKKDRLQELILEITAQLFSTYCISRENFPERDKLNASGVKIRNSGSRETISHSEGTAVIHRSSIYNNSEINDSLKKIIVTKTRDLSPSLSKTIKKLSLYYLYSYTACTFNEKETEKEKRSNQMKIAPVKGRIGANEVLAKEGEIITPEIRGKLEILNRYASRANITSILSLFLVQVVFISFIAFYLRRFRRTKTIDVSSNIVIFIVIWFLVAEMHIASRIFFHPGNSYEAIYYFAIFIPIGMACLILSFIYGEQMSITTGFYLSFLVFTVSRFNPTTFFITFTTAIIASSYATRIIKRIDFLKAGILISGIQIILSVSGYLIDSRNYWVGSQSGSFINDLIKSNIFKLITACLINGFFSATLAQFLLPILEYIFNLPTRFKLQELADTGHPLLQKLLTCAPSTYTHTFLVAALSERAAQNLGLDWLLTRAGVYYHDIGKIPNASFFVENQHLVPKNENIDLNNPGIAAKIVIDHVLDGIEMAKKARLPREVINFIPEHHGTSTMAFFYHKALSTSKSMKKKINRSQFMYPGPKPRRKETAIVMIADSVEAASRSLEETTSEIVDEMIQKIINIKLQENQLDESGLTIGDLNVIKSSFKEVLMSSMHQRPKYPSTEETKSLENKKRK